MKYLNKYSKFFEISKEVIYNSMPDKYKQDQTITLSGSGDQITVTLGDFLNINALPELPLEQFNRVWEKLRDTFKILGLEVNFTNREKARTIEFELSLVKIPYSMCWIHMRKTLEESGSWIDQNYIPLKYEDGYSNFDHLIIYISKDITIVKDPILNVISPGTEEEAYRLIIDKLVDCIDIETSTKVHIGQAHNIFIVGLKDMMVNFTNDNRFFKKDIVLSEEVMKYFYKYINDDPNIFQLLNDIKKHNPILFQALSPYFNGTEIGAEMGELGF